MKIRKGEDMEEKEKKKSNTSSKKRTTSTTRSTNTKSKSTKKSSTTKKKTTPSRTTAKKVVEKKVEEKEVMKTPVTEVHQEPEIKEEKIVEKEENVPSPKKDFEIDYLTIIVLVLVIICAFVACVKLFGKDKKDYSTSYLLKNKVAMPVSCADLPNAIQGKKSYIFVTNVGTEEEYMLEKKMATIIQDKKLTNQFYVFLNEDTCNPSNLKLDSKLEQIPAILYYRDGVLTEKGIREDKTMLQDGDLARIVDIYEE